MEACELRESGESYEPRKTMSISGAFLESACLAGNKEEWSKNVREFVLSCMTQHEIYRMVKTDMLILRFGSLLLKKLGKGRAHDISQKMGLLGRLLLKLMQIDTKMDSLSNFLSGEAFDIVIKGTEELCGVLHTEDGKLAFKTPSLAVRPAHL